MVNDGTVPPELRISFYDKFSTSGKPGGTGLGICSAKLMAQTQLGQLEMQTADALNTTTNVARLAYALYADLPE